MAGLTESTNVNRLITLLMMLPAPDREDHSIFWEKVAEEHSVSTSYITGKIASYLELVLIKGDRPASHRVGFATYALYFFGESSKDLVNYITSSIDGGAPNDSAGQVWVDQLRTTAFAVIEENVPEERVRTAAAEWIRAGHRRFK